MSTTYFVDSVDGLESNVGYDIDHPVATATRALALCVAGDTVYLLTSITEVVTIAKDGITLAGSTVNGGIVISNADNVTITSLLIANATTGISIDANCDSTKIGSDVYFSNVTTDLADSGTNTLDVRIGTTEVAAAVRVELANELAVIINELLREKRFIALQ